LKGVIAHGQRGTITWGAKSSNGPAINTIKAAPVNTLTHGDKGELDELLLM
jgi:hypothetical protein